LLGYLLLEEKRYTETIAMLEQEAAAMQGNKFWDYVMLECLARMNQMDRFGKVATAYIAKTPRKPDAYVAVCEGLLAAKKTQEAVSRLKQWRGEVADGTIKPESKRAFLSALNALEATAYGSNQDWDALDAFMQKTLRNDPNNTKLLMSQATLLEQQGKPAEALKVMRRALKLKGDSALVNNNLAYMMCEANEDLDAAEQMVRTSLATKFSIAATDTLAWILYKKGAFNEAALLLVSILDQADKPEISRQLHPVIWDHAGDALYQLGWHERAKTYWTRALDDGKKMKENTREMREMLKTTPLKLKALAEGRSVPVTPTAPKTKPKTNETKK
jgi:tetratricopeptide (TPR) repeat protein